VTKAVDHLGYVQIDTINVIERCHHHILWSRVPEYRRNDLEQALTVDKTVFEYWTHALSYVPTKDIRFFLPAMKRHRQSPKSWFRSVKQEDLRRILALIRNDGALSIRDINDEVLVEKDHAWASRKPSKRALQLAFYTGALTISARFGMVKTYELMDRHFGWDKRPTAATEQQVLVYLLGRALRSQGVVSLDSICHLDAGRKAHIRRLIHARVRRKEFLPVATRLRDPLSRRAVPLTPVDRSRCICRLLPQIVLPSPNSGRVGVHNFPFEACSGFTHLTARRFAQPPKAVFVAGLRYGQLPNRTACQLPGQPTIARVGLAPTR
jgi:uncharacterized protein YcaQ